MPWSHGPRRAAAWRSATSVSAGRRGQSVRCCWRAPLDLRASGHIEFCPFSQQSVNEGGRPKVQGNVRCNKRSSARRIPRRHAATASRTYSHRCHLKSLRRLPFAGPDDNQRDCDRPDPYCSPHRVPRVDYVTTIDEPSLRQNPASPVRAIVPARLAPRERFGSRPAVGGRRRFAARR